MEGLQLRAVGSSDAAKVRADHPGLRVESDAKAIFEDPAIELVVIATPNPLHAPMARAALACGKHVVVDKPFTETWLQARELVDLADSAGRLLAVFHNRRWDGDFLTLRRLLGEARLGRPVMLESRFDRFRPQVQDRWRERPGPGSGVWFDLGPHLVDQALVLFGLPDSLTADIVTLRDGGQADDDFLVTLSYPRLRVLLRASVLAAAPTPRFTLHGDGGAFVKPGTDPQEADLRQGAAPGGLEWGLDREPGLYFSTDGAPPVPVEGERGDYRRFYGAIRDAVRGDGPNPVPAPEALKVMAILELARESAASGRRAPVADDPRLADALAVRRPLR